MPIVPATALTHSAKKGGSFGARHRPNEADFNKTCLEIQFPNSKDIEDDVNLAVLMMNGLVLRYFFESSIKETRP